RSGNPVEGDAVDAVAGAVAGLAREVRGPRRSVPADGADHRVEGHGAFDRAAGHLGDDDVGAPPPRRGDLFDAGQHPHVLRPTDTVLEVADVVTDQQQRAAGPGGTTGTFQDALHLRSGQVQVG